MPHREVLGRISVPNRTRGGFWEHLGPTGGVWGAVGSLRCAVGCWGAPQVRGGGVCSTWGSLGPTGRAVGGSLCSVGGIGGLCSPWGGSGVSGPYWGGVLGLVAPHGAPHFPLPQSLGVAAQLGETAAEVTRLAGGAQRRAVGECGGGHPKTPFGLGFGGLRGGVSGFLGVRPSFGGHRWDWGGGEGVFWGGSVPIFGVPPPPTFLPTETRVAAMQQRFGDVPKS